MGGGARGWHTGLFFVVQLEKDKMMKISVGMLMNEELNMKDDAI